MNNISIKFFSALLLISATLMSAITAQAQSTDFSVNGVLETEAAAGKNFDSQYYSSANVGKIEVEANKQVNKNLDVTFLFKFEDEGAESGELDKAFLTVNSLLPGLKVFVGRLYLYEYFFETQMISDAVSQEIIELRMEGLSLQYSKANTIANISFYKSQLASEFDHKAEMVVDFSQNFLLGKQAEINIKGLYTSNLVDSQHLSNLVEAEIDKHSPAFGLSLHLHSSFIDVTAQCVRAIESIDNSIISNNGEASKPSACQLELGRSLSLLQQDYFAIGYQWTDQAYDLGFPAAKLLASYHWSPIENLKLAIEISRSNDYDLNDGGTDNSDNTIVTQLAIEF